MRPRIISNFSSLKRICAESGDFDYVPIDDRCSPFTIAKLSTARDIVVIDNSYAYLTELCACRWLLPWWRARLVYADVNLYKPTTRRARLVAWVRGLLLKKVDRFALLFLDSSAYQKYYGLDPKKLRYLPFKVNGWESGLDRYSADPLEGSYVLCAGRTNRDHRTFLKAMNKTGLPGVLLVPADTPAQLGADGDVSIPKNVRLEVHADGKEETFLNWIKGAAVVALPRYATAISPNGISVYLTAMAAWRCVVLTKGPGADDVLLGGEALLVAPEDVDALAEAINIAWKDLETRQRVAISGRRYAERMQGSDRYIRDLYAISIEGWR
jgi:glycosyltransferase involved in cell wall biosynthesis